MKYKIDIQYHSKANKYLKKLNPNEKNKIIGLIDKRARSFIEYGDKGHVFKDSFFPKIGIFDSTLYYVRLDLKNRAIISIDEDPIFEQTIVNVFVICNHEKMELEIAGIVESINQSIIAGEDFEMEDIEE